jgi:2-oxoglutarate dehydrogenase complex dehydrogenase (E1) component-like enzyme
MADMAPGTRFAPIIVNSYNEIEEPAEEVVLCSGKIFFDINNYLIENPSNKAIKVIRVEELAPFPSLSVHEELAGVSRDARVTWVQDEGMN